MEAQKPFLVARFHELMDKPGGQLANPDRHAALAGGKTKSQGDVALARAAVAKRDDVLAPQDVFASRKLQDQHLVERGDGAELEAVEPLHGREASGANAALHHTPLALNQFKLAKPEQIAHMIDAAARAFLGDFFVFGENGWQLELLEMMPEQQLRFIGGLCHAAS